MSTPAAKACPKCSHVSPLDAMICAQCGHPFQTEFMPSYQQPSRPDMIQGVPGMHRPGLAALLSFFLFIGGQVLNKQYLKALVIVVASVFIGAITFTIGTIIIWILLWADAYQVAKRLNRGEAVGQFQFF